MGSCASSQIGSIIRLVVLKLFTMSTTSENLAKGKVCYCLSLYFTLYTATVAARAGIKKYCEGIKKGIKR